MTSSSDQRLFNEEIHRRYFHVYNWRTNGDNYSYILKKARQSTNRYFAEPKPQPTLTPVKLNTDYRELDEANSETSFVQHTENMEGEAVFNSWKGQQIENSDAYKLEILYVYRVPGKRMTKHFINYCLKESGYVLAEV